MTQQKKRKAIIIPGFGEKPNDKPYREVAKCLRKYDYNVRSVRIRWERTTWKEWLKQTALAFRQAGDMDLVFGFSFGAMLAVMLMPRNMKSAILCSVSPYFKEDLSNLPPLAYKMLGKRRMSAFSDASFRDTHSLPDRTTILVAEKDFPLLIRRNELLAKKAHTSVHIVKDAEHDLGDPYYLSAVKKAIKKTAG